MEVNGTYLIYLRKSRGDVELESTCTDVLERHENTLRRLAENQQLSIGGIYREVVSGDSISARPQMQRLLREVESGLWAGVLVMEVERLARGDTIDQGLVQRAFQYTGTLIITPSKIYDPANEFDQEYFEFGLFMSRREYNTIKRRMQAGRYAAAREGKWPFNSAPFGYSRIKLTKEKGWTLEIDESEAPAVRLVFSLFTGAERIGITSIKNYLNERMIKTRSGGKWTESTIRQILENPVYDRKVAIGRRKSVTKIVNGQPVKTRPRSHHAEIYEGRHPRMVPPDIFTEAQEYLGSGKPKPPQSYGIKNPLAGLIICGECKRKMQRRPVPPAKAEAGCGGDMLLCSTDGCPTVGSTLDVVERELIESLRYWLTGYKPETAAPENDTSDYEELLEAGLRELELLLSQRDKICELLEQGIYTAEVFAERSRTIQDRILDARSKINLLQRDLAHVRDKAAVTPDMTIPCQNLLDRYFELSVPDRNKALKLLIDSAEYRKYSPNKYGDRDTASFELIIKPRIPRCG